LNGISCLIKKSVHLFFDEQQLRLTIKKSSKGTYFIQSMRMKDFRRIAKRHKKK
jgi:hypothetical protein